MRPNEDGILIKNIVFDVGGVLLEFAPLKYWQRFVDTAEKAEEMARKTFLSSEWESLDRGLFERREVIDSLCQKYPEDADIIRRAIGSWSNMMEPIEENTRLVSELDDAGYPLYILSNYPQQGFKDVSEKFDFFRHFRGDVISGDVAYVKPEDEIYQVLLDKFSLNPEHTLFIDDNEENIEAAEEAGLVGIHYDEGTDLVAEMRHYNVSI